MNFELSDEARMLQDGLRRYLGDAYGADVRKAVQDGAPAPSVWAGLAEMGVIGALFTEAQGGFGGTGFDIALVFEEMGRAGAVDPLIESGLLAGGLLAEHGDPGGRVEAIVGGGMQIAFAHGEPGGRYASAIRTSAEDGRLTGRKSVVVGAPQADLLLISAVEDGATSLFLVEPAEVSMRPYPLTGGGMAAEIALDAAPGTRVARGAGASIARAEARAALAVCAEALGLMERIRTLTVDYLRTRRQFGRPLGSFQVLQHRMADLLIEIEQARSAVINLSGHVDAEPALRDLHVSAAKNLIGTVAKQVVEESIQMHGGIGMTAEYELAHLARRLTMVDHRFGDALFHLERFIALRAA